MSNLQFLSELTEHAVFDQTYKSHDGCEPATHDTFKHVVFPDLCAAFDLVVHKILLDHPQSIHGITGLE